MIRVVATDDFESIAEITNRYVVGTPIHFAYEPVSPAELRARWISDRDRYPWLVVEGDAPVGGPGGVVGYAKAGVWRARAAYQWTTEVGLYLAESARGRGLGRALYGALVDELVVRGFHSAIAVVTVPNEASTALHRALGFEAVGTVREAGYKLGAWHDIELWQKRLRHPSPLDPPRLPGTADA
jgi:phosphinothricin acetyltransferase